MADTVFTNVQILDGSGDAAVAGEVRVQGNRIKDVAAKVDHEGANVIDGGGATLMPGLVEAHAHPSFTNTTSLEGMGALPPEEHTLLTMRHAKLMLDQGFTSLCCAASAKPRLDIVIRNAIEAGEIPGPRMLAATPEMTVSGGLGDIRLSHMEDRQCFEIICDGPDDFRRRCPARCAAKGVDTLKINPSGDEFVPCAKANQTVMNDEEVAAVVRGRPLARQAGRGPRAERGVGQDVRPARGRDRLPRDPLRRGGARHAGVGEGHRLRRPHPRHHHRDPVRGLRLGHHGGGRDRSGPPARARDRGREHEGPQEAGRPGPAGRRLRIRLEPGREQRPRPRALRELPRVQLPWTRSSRRRSSAARS